MTNKKGIVLSFASGILLSLSFLNFGLDWFVWFGLVPLLIVIEREDNYKFLLKKSALCGIVFFGAGLYWLYFTTAFGLIIVTLYTASYVVLFSLLLKFINNRKALSPLKRLFLIPSLWILTEYARGHLFTGFGWAALGYSQYENLKLIQIADFCGVYGVSFLIVLVNAAIAEVVINIRPLFLFNKKVLIRTCGVVFMALSLVLLVYIYGDIKLNTTAPPEEEVKISIIQGNIKQSQKWHPFYKSLILKKYKMLTKMASFDEPDIIIWPETSLPGYLDESELFKEIKELARDIEIPLLIGAARIDSCEQKYYNSAVLFSKKGSLLNVYDKIHLVPFGEYIPFDFIFGFLRNYAEIADFSRGEIHTIFDVKRVDFGVLICFEDIFPGLVRTFVARGADFMVNITNDAWFLKSSEPYQHLSNSVFRAVENRINVVRAANTGISCFIDPYGRITGKVSSKGEDIFVEGYRTETIKINRINSFYSRFGDVFILIALITATGCVLGAGIKKTF